MKTLPLKKIALLIVLILLTLAFAECTLPLSVTASSLSNPYEPGTDDYYEYEFEKSKARAEWLYGTNLPCTDSDGNSARTQIEGPWKLDLDYTDMYGDGKCSLPWDGTAVTDEEFDALSDVTFHNGSGNVTGKAVSTAEEYCYAVVNHRSFQLQNDIDLGGYLHTAAASRSWVVPFYDHDNPADRVGWTADGGGYTVYNFYLDSSASDQSMFGRAYNLTVQNLRISNAYVTSQGSGNYALAVFVTNAYYTNFFNCGTENTVAYLKSDRRYSAAIYACDGYGLTMDNCYTRNTHLMVFTGGTISCSAHMALGVMNTNITNSYVIDGTVIGNKGHNGGFASCLYDNNNNIKNSFANIDVYGNRDAGTFIGVQHEGSHSIENCYASGKVEGTERLGGFIGTVETGATSTIKQSYSAAMVGMMSNAASQGSFIGSTIDSGKAIDITLADCYAVGEVGSLDVDVSASRGDTYKTTGGFFGAYPANLADSITISRCYYDKQTTAMREWAMGTDASGAGYRSDDTAGLGVKGVLTTDTDKSGGGLTSNPSDHGSSCSTDHKGCFTGFGNDSQWVFQADHYPQLETFARPDESNFKNTNWLTQTELLNLIKAYSQASVSTPKLQTYDVGYAGELLPGETYDTVRDLTLDFYLSSSPNSSWTKDGAETKLFGGASVDVLHLAANGNGSGQWFADVAAPGIEWVTVRCAAGGQTGSKRLRIIPTASLDGGTDQKLKYGETYDHADDVRLAYATGSRLNEAFKNWGEMGYGVTTGIFPDTMLNDYQIEAQIPEGNLDHTPPGSNPPLTGQRQIDFEEQDDLFEQVDASHLSKDLNDNANESELYVSVHEIDSISETGGIVLGSKVPVDNSKSDNPNNDLFNGISPFNMGLGTQYLVEYVWMLSDGRYLEKSKVITSSFKLPEVAKTAKVNDGEVKSGTSDNPVLVNKGDEVEYTITVHNYDTRDAQTNVVITDVLPKGLEYLESSNSGVHTVETENNREVVTWNIDKIPSNTTINVTVKAKVVGYGLFTNQAVVTLEDYDDIKTNETYHKAEGKVTFAFEKVDDVTSEALVGAEFKLYLWEGEGEAAEELVPEELSGSGWKHIDTQVSEGENGFVEFRALIPGEYRLVETEAPDEYRLPTGQWRFEVTEEEAINLLSSVGENKPPDIKGAGTIEEPYLLKNVQEIKSAFHFKKVDASTDKHVGGAEFKLYSWKGRSEAPEELVPNDLTNSGWSYVDTQVSAAKTGMVQLEGLRPGRYQMAETKAPIGYQLPMGQWRFEITDDGELNILSSIGEYMPPAIKGDGTYEAPYLIGNVAKYQLPKMGGSGDFWFIALGILLLMNGSLLTVIKLRKRRRKAGKVS